MNITDKLKLELWIREQVERHQEDFYTELSRILERIEHEKTITDHNGIEHIDTRGKPHTFSLRGWR